MRQRQLEGTFQHAELWEQYQELHRIQARNRGAESDEEANIEGSTGYELVAGFSKMTVKQQRDIVHSLLITNVSSQISVMSSFSLIQTIPDIVNYYTSVLM
jgi:hypothetical protein